MIELTLRINDFDYSSALDGLMPDIISSLQSSGDLSPLLKAACKNQDASARIVSGLISAMPKRQKEQLLVKLVNSNDIKIVKKLNSLAKEHGIDLDISSAHATSY